MSIVYFLSCKFTAQYPEISSRIKDYMKNKYSAKIAGCCKPNLNKITSQDTIVYICNTCAAFFNESTPTKKVISIWELMEDDKDFVLPKFENKEVTIQDCWRTYDNAAQQDAVRQLLENMNINIKELKDNRAKTKFCGCSLYEPLPVRYDELAPKRLVADADGMFIERSQQEKEILMKEHCSSITTMDVVCYCVACVNGIKLGGKNGIHLSELVFGSYLNKQ